MSEIKDTWRFRRRFMTFTALFCAVTIWLCLLGPVTERVAETTIPMAFGIIGTTLSTYVFGAAWENLKNGKTSDGA